jgi:hypothetical protein
VPDRAASLAHRPRHRSGRGHHQDHAPARDRSGYRASIGGGGGRGRVWAAFSWNPSTGEVLRIDPRTNAIAARIRTGGFVGELRLGAGSVWVLSHPEYTDETGGDLVPPVLAAGDDAVWVTSPTAAHPRLALRVDTQTNQVAREQLPSTGSTPSPWKMTPSGSLAAPAAAPRWRDSTPERSNRQR